jgi:hypothetical protein
MNKNKQVHVPIKKKEANHLRGDFNNATEEEINEPVTSKMG